jgi:cholesterol transport system auxiliary component
VTATRAAPRQIDFIIEEPSASGVLNTDRILVRPSSTQVQYLPDARWSESAPAMIRSAMVDSFERSGAFRYVGRDPLALSGNLVLVTNLTAFHADVEPQTDTGTVRVSLVARLVREDGAAIIATRTFSREVAVPNAATATIVAAYEVTAQGVLADLTQWVLGTRGIS